MHILKNMLLVVFVLLLSSMKGEAQTAKSNIPSGFPKHTVFSAGDNNVNSYRIPSLIVAKDGSIIVFCKHSKKCTFYTLRFGCSFAAVNTIKPQLL